VFWFPVQLLFEIFLILRRIERDVIKNLCWSSSKVPVLIVRFEWNLKFRDKFSGNTQRSNFIKILQVGGPMFSMRTKLVVDFCKFAKTPKTLSALFGHNAEIIAVVMRAICLPVEFKRFTIKMRLLIFICTDLEWKMTRLIYSYFGWYLGSNHISELASKPIRLYVKAR
jgi:hypothetical protein